MTDIEITRACAAAMRASGIVECKHPLNIEIAPPAIWVKDYEYHDGYFYSPLTEYAQTLALIRDYPIVCLPALKEYADGEGWAKDKTLNRVICEHIAASVLKEPTVEFCTQRDGVDEIHLECRMSDGQKGAFVKVNHSFPDLATEIEQFLNGSKAT